MNELSVGNKTIIILLYVMIKNVNINAIFFQVNIFLQLTIESYGERNRIITRFYNTLDMLSNGIFFLDRLILKKNYYDRYFIGY